MKINEQEFFRDLLSLVGTKVEGVERSSGAPFSGTITNVMFDSFILDSAGKNRIISFRDLYYIQPLSDL